jgi:hypothetical protein
VSEKEMPPEASPDFEKSALDFEILRRRLALIRDLVVLDHLPLIQAAEAGFLDSRDMDKYVFATASPAAE